MTYHLLPRYLLGSDGDAAVGIEGRVNGGHGGRAGTEGDVPGGRGAVDAGPRDGAVCLQPQLEL